MRPYRAIFHSGTCRDEHLVIAEKVLGRKLPLGAQVHHVDFNGRNNANENLVICQDQKYHKLLHLRSMALAACGNANHICCCRCKGWGEISTMRKHTKNQYAHPACANSYARSRYHA